MPIVSYGVRAYVDVPYLLLVLSASIVESAPRSAKRAVRRCSRCWRSPGCCGPEAWAFSGLYWLYLLLLQRRCARGESPQPPAGARSPGQLGRLALLVAAAPLVWV